MENERIRCRLKKKMKDSEMLYETYDPATQIKLLCW